MAPKVQFKSLPGLLHRHSDAAAPGWFRSGFLILYQASPPQPQRLIWYRYVPGEATK